MVAAMLRSLSSDDVRNSQILAMEQRREIQIIAIATSSISLLAAICAMYWFVMMRRNFRRDLILLLICGDFWKSLWCWTYAVVAVGYKQTMDSGAPFCQTGGYFLQVGFESCGE